MLQNIELTYSGMVVKVESIIWLKIVFHFDAVLLWITFDTKPPRKSLVELTKMLFIRSKVTLHLLNSTRVLMSFSEHSSYFCHSHTALHLPSIVIYVYFIPFIEFFHTSLSKNKFLLQIFWNCHQVYDSTFTRGWKLNQSALFLQQTLFF